jgi:hypothetical protein
MKKIILDLCGGTGAWSKKYKEAGYVVINVTLPFYDVTKTEFKGDYIIFQGGTKNPLKVRIIDIYGILAAPPCTEFSFAKSNSKYPRNIKRGMKIVIACLNIIWVCQYKLPTPLAKTTTLKFWALENPFGLLKRFLGHPVMIFNPYDFGDGYQKKTCLWGYFNLPKKNPVEFVKDYIHTIGINGKPLKKFDMLLTKEIYPEYYGKLTRQERRAITPPGFAKAFFEANK